MSKQQKQNKPIKKAFKKRQIPKPNLSIVPVKSILNPGMQKHHNKSNINKQANKTQRSKHDHTKTIQSVFQILQISKKTKSNHQPLKPNPEKLFKQRANTTSQSKSKAKKSQNIIQTKSKPKPISKTIQKG